VIITVSIICSRRLGNNYLSLPITGASFYCRSNPVKKLLQFGQKLLADKLLRR
jgi:hypothetical protein